VESPYSVVSVPADARHPVGMAAAILGLVLWCESVLFVLGAALYALFEDDSMAVTVFASVLLCSGVPGAVAGFRLSARRRAGMWIVPPLLVHALFILLAVSAIVRKART